MPISLILTVLLILFVLTMLAKTVRVIPQGRAGIVERLGKFRAVLKPGLHIVIPVVDRVLPLIDLREQVVSFPSQSVITEDNLVVGIDTVVYFQVTDPQAATYEITNYIRAVDELTSATLRNVVGGLNLEQTLTSRDQINAELRGVLGHELMHVYNRDILTSSVAAGIASIIGIIAQVLSFGAMFGGSNRDDNRANPLAAFVIALLAPIATQVIQMAISRTREYDADEDGARLTRDPIALASALNKLEHGVSLYPMDPNNRSTQAASAMMIANPFGSLQNVMSTHPPMNQRIARLQQMAREMGQY